MTIDEAIKEEQILYDIAKDKYEKFGIDNCLKRMEEHKQYIEWLEELKYGYRNPTDFRRWVKVAKSDDLCYICVMGMWKSKKQTQVFVTVPHNICM